MSPSNSTPPSTSEVRIGRLERKLNKVKKQRDHYKELYEHYAKVISMQPYIERRYNSFIEMQKEVQRIRGLEARVKEQEKLIKLLSPAS